MTRTRLEWTVTSKESGSKLLAFLTYQLKGVYSARYLKGLIEQNSCQINKRVERFASTILGQGDQICLYLDDSILPGPSTVEANRILFEDEALLIYNKPARVNSDEKDLLQLWKGTYTYLQLVHRLDRDTTGVLILAKQPLVLSRLVAQFKQFEVYKHYLAIVDGAIVSSKGRIDNYLGKKRAYAGQTIWGSVLASQGRQACTEWERLEKSKEASLVACYPQTGRTHQIRVHLSEMGHPILGDYQYGHSFQCAYRPSRLLLHAYHIRFKHPLTGKSLSLTAPLPDDFKIAQQMLFKRA